MPAKEKNQSNKSSARSCTDPRPAFPIPIFNFTIIEEKNKNKIKLASNQEQWVATNSRQRAKVGQYSLLLLYSSFIEPH